MDLVLFYLVLLAIPTVVGALFSGSTYSYYDGKRHPRPKGDAALFGFATGAIIAGVLTAMGFIGSMVSASTTASLEAFYHDTYQTYEVVADRTEEMVIQVPGARLTDLAQQAQSAEASMRLAELRDQVAEYNENLHTKQIFESWPVLNHVVYDVAPDLKPIRLEENA